MLSGELEVDEIDHIYYVWNMVTKDILNPIDYSIDIIILDVSDINGLEIAIPNIDNNTKKKIYDKIIINKYIIPTLNLEMFMEDLNIDYKYRHMLEDYMNKCSYFLDGVVNFYVPMTGSNIMFTDEDMISDELDKGIWLRSARFVNNDESNKILLTFSVFRKKGIL